MKTLRPIIMLEPEHSRWICVCRFEKFGGGSRARRICNSGPLTLELSDGVSRGMDSLRKVGLFIRAFVDSSCQQTQLNTLNVETLRDAQSHPERHKKLRRTRLGMERLPACLQRQSTFPASRSAVGREEALTSYTA
jgi:glycine radical enzyme